MTTEEKLKIAVEFIRNVKNMEIPSTSVEEFIDVEVDTDDDYDGDMDVSVRGGDTEVVEVSFVEELKDKAWHALADMEEL